MPDRQKGIIDSRYLEVPDGRLPEQTHLRNRGVRPSVGGGGCRGRADWRPTGGSGGAHRAGAAAPPIGAVAGPARAARVWGCRVCAAVRLRHRGRHDCWLGAVTKTLNWAL